MAAKKKLKIDDDKLMFGNQFKKTKSGKIVRADEKKKDSKKPAKKKKK